MLLLDWCVHSEHAPFFLGLARGYFAQEGIDLQIQEGRAGERKLLVEGLKLTLPLYHTERTKNEPAFRVSPADFADSVSMLVDCASVDKSATSRPKDFYTLDYLP